MSSLEFSTGGAELTIREARLDDATAACDVVRTSIVELCVADHGGDRGQLALWLANKTPDNFRTWIAQSHVFLASRGNSIVGVAALTGGGEITLHYVSPSHRFTGISRALLLGVEERARDLGLSTCTLDSTQTALAFYYAAGYRDRDGYAHQAKLAKSLQ